MLISRVCKFICMMVAVGILACDLQAQSLPASGFERCSVYATALAELESQYRLAVDHRMQLISQRSDILQRLDTCKRDCEGLQSLEVFEQLHRYQLEVEKQAVNYQLNQAASEQDRLAQAALARAPELNAARRTRIDAASNEWLTRIAGRDEARWSGSNSPFRNDSLDLPNIQPLTQKWAQLSTATGMSIQRARELNAAQRLTFERYRKTINELQSVVLQMSRIPFKQAELFAKYFQYADISGMRSRVEHRAALRELERSDFSNVGALFVAALTLSRLDREEDAIAMLTKLAQAESLRAVALAARAEILMRKGDRQASRKDQADAMALAGDDPRVRMFCAQAKCVDAELKSTLDDWEFALKHGAPETLVRRTLALIYCSLPHPTQRQLQIADEYSQIACSLSADNDWGSMIARALAHAANGRSDEALAAAESALELAIGEQKLVCQSIADHIQAGQPVTWRF